MKTKIIVDNILYAYDLEVFSTEFRPEKVYSAIENFDYFVKPGYDTVRFWLMFQDTFKQVDKMIERSKSVCDFVGFPFNYEHTKWVHTAFALIELVKVLLDEDFFKTNLDNNVEFRCEDKKPFFIWLKNNRELYDMYMHARNYPVRMCLKDLV